ncbi:G-type lectin S-receptor-like serine/threonine-protein kinase At4g27290 [Bidens hawaiensis]|uniref:G-type lectin S-receptor-like serine/threonine-protein kinase At4g27290 n=1 Tax=Bidens hawaiensis TaxID=980011 RepID=UPI00404A1B8A
MEERRVIKTKFIIPFLVVIFASICCSIAVDTISANQIVKHNETIVSPRETFELGFFRPVNSTNHYVGIWYKTIPKQTVVWVANRNKPLTDNSSELTLTLQGVLILRNPTTGVVIWSTGNSSSAVSVKNPIGRLLDTGNFIIQEEGGDINQEDPIWQSFDFITDTLLAGMKQGRNFVTGIERNMTSWKSNDDPALGDFSYWIDTRGYPQRNLCERGGKIKFRGGPWNGLRFTGIPYMKPNEFYTFTFVLNSNEVYYQYELKDNSVFMRLVLNTSGHPERLLWSHSKQEWALFNSPIKDNCDEYAVCGPYGSCNIEDSPNCQCLKGFEPKSPDQWRDTNWSSGCRHTITLDCNSTEGFKMYSNLKLPDTTESWYDLTMTLVECEKKCKSNCSCTAYTYTNRSGSGSGCVLWFGGLIDIRTFAEDGDSLYIRLSASELESEENSSRSSSAARKVQVIIPVAFVVLVILASICLFYSFKRKKKQQQETIGNISRHGGENRSGDEDLELPLFGLSTIHAATNNFSLNNKLGEGGFGPVYKGILEDGHEIAVKRLSKTSTQGLHEFMNEVISISKLQHRNLVKLMGCCIEGAETMLIYEYMPNNGLDSFIFDKTQSELLDWTARYRIIDGIARGLLYLHQDSRLRIIHRDLKLSNILLDMDMNPKISDFGMARTFGGNQIEANTNRVVGTYGYMAPEYAGDGNFSIKSDVYSFGVLVLEIVCGRRNRGFAQNENFNNLIGHAWSLHNEGRSLELADKCLGESINVSQVLRSIHVSLLCVQRHPEDRPTMTNVILMLGSEGPLPSPNEPGFYVGNTKHDTTPVSSSCGISNNELSISVLSGR